MRDVRLSLETDPQPRDVDALAEGLNEQARTSVGRAGFQPLALFARDPVGALVGGAHGQVNWNWLYVSLLWVSTARRREGLGSKLLDGLEAAARERGCRSAHLDTFSYQARPFYERHGYTVFATLDDYPPGHQRFFLRKALEPGSAPWTRTVGARPLKDDS